MMCLEKKNVCTYVFIMNSLHIFYIIFINGVVYNPLAINICCYLQGSATLSMALAGARFTNALLRGLKGENNVQCSYVASDAVKGVEYFSTPVELGPNGVEKILGVGKVSHCFFLN